MKLRAAAFFLRCRAQSMQFRHSLIVLESMAKMPRFIRARKPLCLLYCPNPGQTAARWSKTSQYSRSAMAASRRRFALENVLRFGGCAPRMLRHSLSWTRAASTIPLRLSQPASWPYISATTWLTADHLRMSSLYSSASRWIIPAGIHWTSCRSTVYTVFVGFGGANPSNWGINFFIMPVGYRQTPPKPTLF